MEKRKVGRPKKFECVEDMQILIDEYFKKCDELENVYSVNGMCLFLEITRETLLVYNNDDEYSDTIKRAKMRIETQVEEFASMNKINSVFAIFNLKNNFGWKDKQEIESNNNNNNVNSGDVNINIRVVE